MGFWNFLGLILSFFTEIFNSELCSISLGNTNFSLTFGSISVFCILLGILIHLLVPSAKGV